jgi:hypothetical protein
MIATGMIFIFSCLSEGLKRLRPVARKRQAEIVISFETHG